jgi:enoyl-CoA hydratase
MDLEHIRLNVADWIAIMRYAKEDANAVEEVSLRDAYRYEQNITIALSKTEAAREAQSAFIEKRKPVFKGP